MPITVTSGVQALTQHQAAALGLQDASSLTLTFAIVSLVAMLFVPDRKRFAPGGSSTSVHIEWERDTTVSLHEWLSKRAYRIKRGMVREGFSMACYRQKRAYCVVDPTTARPAVEQKLVHQEAILVPSRTHNLFSYTDP
jgi:hypothetical protein